MNRLAASPRLWLVGGAVAALLILAIGWLAVIGPERSSASDLRDQAAETQLQNDLLRGKVAVLKAKSAKKSQIADSLRRAQAALPADSGLPSLTRQLNAQARTSGVRLSGLVVGGVSPLQQGSGGTTPSASATATPAAGTLFSVNLTLTTTGSLSDQLTFLQAVRSGARRALVTSTQVTAGSGASTGSSTGPSASSTGSLDRSSTFTTNLTVFSAPQSPQELRQARQLLAGLRG